MISMLLTGTKQPNNHTYIKTFSFYIVGSQVLHITKLHYNNM